MSRGVRNRLAPRMMTRRRGRDGAVRGGALMAMGDGPGADWDVGRVTLGRHFLRDMEGLWENVLKLAAVVETALHTSIQALCDGRADLAAEVKGGENAIN